MKSKIWFNLQRLYYSSRGIDFRGDVFISHPEYNVGDLIEVSGAIGGIKNGTYRISSVN
jgi:hypothetical protein